MKMYKLGRYKQTDRMSDLICENYPMLLVISRFGISLGFGDKTIGEVCEDSGVDTKTFLTIVNLLLDDLRQEVTCTACGAKTKSDNSFCPKCGAKLPEKPAPAEEEPVAAEDVTAEQTTSEEEKKDEK